MKRSATVTALLVAGVIALAALPLLLVEGEFAGSDGAAQDLIAADHPGYQPWWEPLFNPSPEVASGLFALQAAIGAAVIGYYFGVARTRRKLGQRQGRGGVGEGPAEAGDC